MGGVSHWVKRNLNNPMKNNSVSEYGHAQSASLQQSEALILECLKALQESLLRHNDLYYVHQAPEITDAEYDALYRKFVDLTERHPAQAAQLKQLRLPIPTEIVGAAPDRA